jgi:hypothetical protein
MWMNHRKKYLRECIDPHAFEKETKMEEMRVRATPYSSTDKQETLAIDTFRYLVDHEKVKLDLKERDKYPNIDGNVEIVDENRRPIAKLEVQIKKLPDGEQKIQSRTIFHR